MGKNNWYFLKNLFFSFFACAMYKKKQNWSSLTFKCDRQDVFFLLLSHRPCLLMRIMNQCFCTGRVQRGCRTLQETGAGRWAKELQTAGLWRSLGTDGLRGRKERRFFFQRLRLEFNSWITHRRLRFRSCSCGVCVFHVTLRVHKPNRWNTSSWFPVSHWSLI